MKRGKCYINYIEFNFPVSALKDIISSTETGNVRHWKGQCLDPTTQCKIRTEISQNVLSICIQETRIAFFGTKLKCCISDIEPISELSNTETAEKSDTKDGGCTTCITNNGENVLPKRTRGRPRKSCQENKLNSSNKEIVCDSSQFADLVENETKRYGLRGVKISEAIMRAEMGSAYRSKPTENEDGDKMSIEKDTHEDDCKPEEDENVDDEKDVDYIDDDYVGYVSDEEEFEPVNVTGRSTSAVNGKRKNKIDIGDVQIPKYRKKETFKKDKECRYCQKRFYHFVGVEDHVSKFHLKEADVEAYLKELKSLQIETCQICNKTFNNRYHLIEHEKRSHLENASVKCFKCGKLYKNVQSLKNHMRAVHSVIGQPYACHLCTAKFKWSTTLKQHIEEIHEGKMKAICKFCGKKFPRQNLLNRHIRIHGTDQSKRLVCKTCGKGFWYEHNLQRHMKVIHGPHEENYHCSYCGKGFGMKSAMVTHVQQVHFNIFPFRCNDCNVGFKRSKLYQLHMVKEHNVLDVGSLNINNRQRFKYGKTEEDLFYCSHCSLSFCYKTKMVEHMHSAHGEDFPYMCTYCNQGFLEKAFLSHHLLKAHNEILPANETKEEEENRFQMVTIDINGQKKELEVESFHLPQPVFIEKTEEVENIVNVELKDNQDISGQTLFFEVSKGADTIHYVIEQAANGRPTILPQELANLLVAAEQSLQGINEDDPNEIQLITQKTESNEGPSELQLPVLSQDPEGNDSQNLQTNMDYSEIHFIAQDIETTDNDNSETIAIKALNS